MPRDHPEGGRPGRLRPAEPDLAGGRRAAAVNAWPRRGGRPTGRRRASPTAVQRASALVKRRQEA